MEIYEPQEDSFLLLSKIKDYAKGRVLDMGCGSAILTKEAAMYADDVVGADINCDAIALARKNNKLKNVSYVESDLFTNVEGTFDLILFNAPYLPSDKNYPDLALDGGEKGYVVITRFLSQAIKHLAPKGTILLLCSSLSGTDVIEKGMKEQGYQFKIIADVKYAFERLYIYETHYGQQRL